MQIHRMKRDADENPTLSQAGVQSVLFTAAEAAYTRAREPAAGPQAMR